MIRTMNLATPEAGSPVLVDPADMASFNALQTQRWSLESVKVLDVDGALYVLHPVSAKGPLAPFVVADVEAEEEALDAAIAALPEPLRAKLAPTWEPIAAKRAKRAADDAEAEVRRLAATKADEAKLAAAVADAEAKRAAADALTSSESRA